MQFRYLPVVLCLFAVFSLSFAMLPAAVLAEDPVSIVRGGGDDLISIELGDYTIDGGGGTDTLALPMFPNVYQFTEVSTNQYTATFLDYTLTIDNVEYVQFGTHFPTKLPIANMLSDNVQDQLAKLTDLYLAFFGRAADVSGLEYWQEKIFVGGKDFVAISKDFAWSAEAQALYPQDGSNRDFVQTVYQNCFGRNPDEGGWNYWTDRLNALGVTDLSDRGVFVGNLLLGAYAPTSGDEDRNLLTNRHEVALSYVNRLSKQPEEGFDAAINDLLVLVTDDPEMQIKAKHVIDYVFEDQVSLAEVMNSPTLLNALWGNGGTGIDQDCDDIIDNCLPSTLVFETTLGVDGGSIGDDGFNLKVSPESFSGDTVLRVYNDTDNQPLGDPGTLYRVQGIPSDYTGTLSVRMKSSWANEDSRIIVGEQVFASSLAGLTEGYHMLDGRRDGDYLVVEIPASGASDPAVLQVQSSRNINAVLNRQPEEVQLSFGIFSVKTLRSSQGHFRIIYPSGVENKAVALAVYLEDAYSAFSSMGYSYAGRTRWPVDVTLGPMDSEGSYSHSLFGNNYGTIKIDSQLPVNNLSTTAGHEFFHLVQYLYDPRLTVSKVWGSPSHYWFNEATATWAEEKFLAGGYVPPNMELNRMAPFDGMHKVVAGSMTAADVADHGYGMASLIKYIAINYGEHTIRDIYRAISADSSFDLVSEIEKRLDPIDYNVTAVTWWWKYLRALVFGDVYPGLLDPNFLSSYVHGEWKPVLFWSEPTTNGPTITQASINFNRDFTDYSGGLYIVNLTGNLNNFTNRSYFNTTLDSSVKGEGWEFYRFKQRSPIDLNAWLDMTTCWPGFVCDRGLDSYELIDMETAGESVLMLVVKSKSDPPSTELVPRTLHMEFMESGYWNCGVTPTPPACY